VKANFLTFLARTLSLENKRTGVASSWFKATTRQTSKPQAAIVTGAEVQNCGRQAKQCSDTEAVEQQPCVPPPTL
jgi:hypothetical protein